MKTICAILVLTAVVAGAPPSKTIRAALQAPENRKPAPFFRLMNATGKPVRTSDLRGKVVLLDFWATECGGCKIEIPWFIDLELSYKSKGLNVVGISMDILYEGLKSSSEGWSKVKPFVNTHKVNYPVLMGDEAIAKAYDIQAMPATYLLDKNGRIAATYVGIVDKDDIEANMKALIAE